MPAYRRCSSADQTCSLVGGQALACLFLQVRVAKLELDEAMSVMALYHQKQQQQGRVAGKVVFAAAQWCAHTRWVERPAPPIPSLPIPSTLSHPTPSFTMPCHAILPCPVVSRPAPFRPVPPHLVSFHPIPPHDVGRQICGDNYMR